MAQINKPNQYFNTVLYTGNGTARDITTGLTSTDLVWIKRRDGIANHRLTDVVRGATNMLSSNNTNATQTDAQTVTAFGTNTFSLGTDSGGYDVNTSSQTYASWNWSANGTGVSNTDGDITSTVSANTTSGFSIVTFTGNGTASGTVGHGLGVAPKIVLYKKRNGTSDWFYWTTQIDGSNDDLRLNTTGTKSDLSGTSGSITASTFSNYGWGSSDNMVCYCFAEKKGFSKFGSYTGNGSTDGTFIYTGFKPAWFMIKRTDTTSSWSIFDNRRSVSGGFNVIDYVLYPDLSDVEDTATHYSSVDFLSNGIKCRQGNGGLNASGGSYIYMAFASEPLVGTNNTPATAR